MYLNIELRFRTVIMSLFVVAEQNLNVITIHGVIVRIVTTEGEGVRDAV